MYNLPINRDNVLWAKINSQFLKGGFQWYNRRHQGNNNWYYLYYIGEGEKRSAKKVSRHKKWNKVTNWLRHIEKFEEIKEKYEMEMSGRYCDLNNSLMRRTTYRE